MSLRRSTRRTKGVSYAGMSKSCYPDSPPMTDREKRFHELNLQAFPIEPYLKVDDALVFSLFATKRRPNSYRRFNPTAISGVRNIDAAEGIAIAKACFEGISPLWNPAKVSPSNCRRLSHMCLRAKR
jgi:hypothetical protein